MDKSPLIEMAEYHEGQSAYALEYHTRNVQARSTHQLYLQKAAKHANDARITPSISMTAAPRSWR